MSCLRYLILLSLLARAQSLQCKNADGVSVDWFAMYKMPKIAQSNIPFLDSGLAVMYLDGSNPSWTHSSFPVNGINQALYHTLAPVYSQNNDMMLIMYNDQPPNKNSNQKYGHTKGVVAFDGTAGFWLVHSVPRFPSVPKEGYKWSDAQPKFGQSFLCISFPYQALANISQQLFYNYPQVYVHQVPTAFQSRFPMLSQVGDEYPTSPPWTSDKILLSLARKEFRSFAKFTKFNADLYYDFVAPTLKSSLLVEAWSIGRSKNLPNNCSTTYKVMNVEEISIDGGLGRVTFQKSQEHAKWAVSAFPEDGDWVCIGDINRQESQLNRAGGTVCFKDPRVWSTFRSSVASVAGPRRHSRSISISSYRSSSSCPYIPTSYSSSSSFSLSFSASLFPLFVVVVQVVSL